jgi:co-chaperonin GroES (HSP10)
MDEAQTVGQRDGMFDKKLRIVSKDKVALRAFVKNTERIIGGIYLLEKFDINMRMNKYEITDIGTKAAEETGLKIGDIVCADALARFYDTFPVSVIKYENIIFRTNKSDTKIYPLRNMVIVELDKLVEDNKNGIVVMTDLLPVGTITHINVDKNKKCQLKVGDKILITNECDLVVYKGKKLYIFKYNDIVAKVEEE